MSNPSSACAPPSGLNCAPRLHCPKCSDSVVLVLCLASQPLLPPAFLMLFHLVQMVLNNSFICWPSSSAKYFLHCSGSLSLLFQAASDKNLHWGLMSFSSQPMVVPLSLIAKLTQVLSISGRGSLYYKENAVNKQRFLRRPVASQTALKAGAFHAH